jgi:hypothetical protein
MEYGSLEEFNLVSPAYSRTDLFISLERQADKQENVLVAYPKCFS